MKKRKKKKRTPQISKNRKFWCNVIFVILFSIIVLLMIDPIAIFLLTHKSFNYVYIIPTKTSIILYYFGFVVFSVFLFKLYDKMIYHGILVKDYFIKKKKTCVLLLLFLIFINLFGYFSFYYIDNNYNYGKRLVFKTEEILADEIEEINISTENVVFSSTRGGPIFDDYIIVCNIKTNKDEYVMESSGFYDYAYMYNYLSKFNSKISVDNYRLDELIEFQDRNMIVTKVQKDKNKENIKKIFLLGKQINTSDDSLC